MRLNKLFSFLPENPAKPKQALAAKDFAVHEKTLPDNGTIAIQPATQEKVDP